MSPRHRVLAQLLLAFGFILAVPLRVSATCISFMPASGSEAYVFMDSVITSMAYAQDGVAGLKKGTDAGRDALVEFLHRTKRAQEDYSCAEEIVRRFTGSKDELIGPAAETLVTVYAGVREASRRKEAHVIEVMNLPESVAPGTLAEQVAAIRQVDDYMWTSLTQSLVFSMATLRDVKPPSQATDGSKSRRLRVTRAERQALKRHLAQIFGGSIQKGARAGQDYLEAAGAELYSFLESPEFRSSDDR